MNEYRIYRILKPIYSIIPPSFVITHEGLARCKSSLLRGIGLCRAELLFLQRFKPLHQRNIIEYEMLFESAEQPIIRLSSDDDKRFWRKWFGSTEYKELNKIIYRNIIY